LPGITNARQIGKCPKRLTKGKTKKRKKDRPYKNSIKTNGETQSDVSAFQKLTKLIKKQIMEIL